MRYYSPGAGRFLSEDPIGFRSGDFNLYRYASNTPVLNNDPFGLKWGTSDFLKYYWNGNGTTVNLGSSNVGLLLDIQNALSTQTNNYKNKLEEIAWIVALARGTKGGYSNKLSGSSKQYVNLTSTVFVLGHTQLNMKYSITFSFDPCGKEGQYSFNGKIDYSISDSFSDPADLGNWIGPDIEMPFATPYSITGSWTEMITGSGTFPK
jgi:hypothetical protein